jgi:hypothetical protein
MKTSTIACAIAATLTSMLTHPAGAEGAYRASRTPWVVYRDALGQLTPESIPAAQKMRQKAARDGYITLWLEVGPNGAGKPAAANVDFGRVCQKILEPLAARALISHPSSGPRNTGPVCLIRAKPAGLSVLLRDERFRQIMGANDVTQQHQY